MCDESDRIPLEDFQVTCHRFDRWYAGFGWQKTLTWEIHGGGKHAYGDVSGFTPSDVDGAYMRSVYQVLARLGAERLPWDTFSQTRFARVL